MLWHFKHPRVKNWNCDLLFQHSNVKMLSSAQLDRHVLVSATTTNQVTITGIQSLPNQSRVTNTGQTVRGEPDVSSWDAECFLAPLSITDIYVQNH